MISLATAPSLAATYYVSNKGSDTSPGSITSPWKTLQKAASSLKPGDIAYARSGTYKERVTVNVSGTAAAPISFASYPGETAVIDFTGIKPPAGTSGMVNLKSRNYIIWQGFEVRNFSTSVSGITIAAFFIQGSSTGVQILDNSIHHIQHNNANEYDFDSSALAIAVYGNSSSPLNGIVIRNNTISDLRLGASEAVALNGNVTNFTVADNTICNCNNIGIDIIGYEGTCPTSSLDRARDGVISGNTVYGIDSRFNPAYGGSLTSGGGVQAAAGIYVDGGLRVTIERNHVYRCNYGVELASEAARGATEEIVLRNNLIRHNHLSGITLGGYDYDRGITKNCTITNNTLYQNGATSAWSPQIQFQYYCRSNLIANNLVWGRSDTKLIISQWPEEGTNSQKDFSSTNTFAYNLYYAGGSSELVFQFFSGGKQKAYYSLEAWRAAAESKGEVGTTSANPLFAVAVPSTSASPTNFRLSSKSTAIGTGQPLLPSQSKWGSHDFFCGPRLNGARVDRGMAEY